MLLDDPDQVGLTGPGKDVGTLVAADVHVEMLVGQIPLAVGATWIEPGELEVVAQFTWAELWVRSVT
jgi:hypothetical protein